MGHKFFKIDNKETLEKLITDSKSKPVVIFKHSNACGISSAAYREMEKLEDQVNLLEVQSARLDSPARIAADAQRLGMLRARYVPVIPAQPPIAKR